MHLAVPIVDAILQITLVAATIGLAIFTALMWWSTRSVSLGTASLGRETAELARETAALARETLAASAVADQHHQEAMTPLVILEDAVVNSPGLSLQVTGVLHNIGPGIALDVRVWIGEIGEQIHVGPIAANQSKQISCAVATGDTVRQNRPIKLVLLYNNLFRSEGRTEHYGKCHVKDSFNTVFYPPALTVRVRQTET